MARRIPTRRVPVAVVFVVAGTLHFVFPAAYERIVPRALPAPRALVYASGVAEIAGGAAALPARTAPLAGWWLAATLVAVAPANVSMAVRAEEFPGVPEPLLWARLPLQGLLVAWVLSATRRPARRRARPSGRRRGARGWPGSR